MVETIEIYRNEESGRGGPGVRPSFVAGGARRPDLASALSRVKDPLEQVPIPDNVDVGSEVVCLPGGEVDSGFDRSSVEIVQTVWPAVRPWIDE